MRLWVRYLKSRIGEIALFIAFALIFFIAFTLYRLPMEAVAYPAGLCLLLGTGYFLWSFLRFQKRHAALEGLKRLESGLPDPLPKARDAEAEDWREIVRLLQTARVEEQARAETDFQAMTDYYTLWAHQIKTPIASMRLKLEGRDDMEARSLLTDLKRIERYVEMVLTYLRLEGSGTDFVFRECSLDDLLRGVFKELSGEFISRRLTLNYQPIEEYVLTDDKWLTFVLEQVLSNALKYTPEGSISVCLEPPHTLCIQDTGIGIAPEDLPRVFDESYTGITGRQSRQATGIGLYLCKRVLDDLGNAISIESEPGKGTTVRIDLARQAYAIE